MTGGCVVSQRTAAIGVKFCPCPICTDITPEHLFPCSQRNILWSSERNVCTDQKQQTRTVQRKRQKCRLFVSLDNTARVILKPMEAVADSVQEVMETNGSI